MWESVQGEKTAAEVLQRHLYCVFKRKRLKEKGEKEKSVPLHVPAQAESHGFLL